MLRELLRASGFLFILLPPLLLAWGVSIDMPGLAFVVLFFVAPFLRVVFGDADEMAPEWSEPVATALEWLPNLFGLVFAAAIGFVLWRMGQGAFSGGQWVWLGLSLWATSIFASCPTHELAHRRSAGSQFVGRLLAGALGYPLLEHEHRAHHTRGGDVDNAEWPRVDEALWAFTARRSIRVLQSAWDGNVTAAQRRGRRFAGGLPLSVSATLVTWLAFALAGAGPGVWLYATVVAAVFWTMQAITYVQHWGLGVDSVRDAVQGHHGWEDRCRLQVWLTVAISYHQAHHHRTSTPYYRQAPMRGSPRMPAGYVVLLFASLAPPVWRALMLPALHRWQRDPLTQPSAGRRLICLTRQQT